MSYTIKSGKGLSAAKDGASFSLSTKPESILQHHPGTTVLAAWLLSGLTIIRVYYLRGPYKMYMFAAGLC